MAVQILMPALSPTMEEGTLAKWLVKEGDKVKSGQILAEIETDKATMEFEAVDEGIVGTQCCWKTERMPQPPQHPNRRQQQRPRLHRHQRQRLWPNLERQVFPAGKVWAYACSPRRLQGESQRRREWTLGP